MGAEAAQNPNSTQNLSMLSSNWDENIEDGELGGDKSVEYFINLMMLINQPCFEFPLKWLKYAHKVNPLSLFYCNFFEGDKWSDNPKRCRFTTKDAAAMTKHQQMHIQRNNADRTDKCIFCRGGLVPNANTMRAHLAAAHFVPFCLALVMTTTYVSNRELAEEQMKLLIEQYMRIKKEIKRRPDNY